jgi:hypothetical protein
MPKYYKGIENTPLKEVNVYCPITVFVIDLLNDSDVVHQEDLDLASVVDRRRLGRLTFWAVSNNHSIETMSIKDARAEFVK